MKGKVIVHIINDESIHFIEKLFGIKSKKRNNSYFFNIINNKIKKEIRLELHIESENDILVSVYTENSHLQLQSCKGFFISKMLEEVIFISEHNNKISGLIISNQGDCSLYANVDKSILSKNFLDLNSEKILSAVALSILDSSEN